LQKRQEIQKMAALSILLLFQFSLGQDPIIAKPPSAGFQKSAQLATFNEPARKPAQRRRAPPPQPQRQPDAENQRPQPAQRGVGAAKKEAAPVWDGKVISRQSLFQRLRSAPKFDASGNPIRKAKKPAGNKGRQPAAKKPAKQEAKKQFTPRKPGQPVKPRFKPNNVATRRPVPKSRPQPENSQPPQNTVQPEQPSQRPQPKNRNEKGGGLTKLSTGDTGLEKFSVPNREWNKYDVTVIILDMTWSHPEYWQQALAALLDKISKAPGMVYVATTSPYSSKAGIFKDPVSFVEKILPLLSRRVSMKASQICHDVRYGQMRGALDELREMQNWSPRRCSTLIFTDTAVVKQSNELFCRGVEEDNASDCLLDSVFESRGCPLANVHLFGNCNSESATHDFTRK